MSSPPRLPTECQRTSLFAFHSFFKPNRSVSWSSLRVDLPNPFDRHHANTFGTAEVILRDEPEAVIVPAGAVHWEGCCHIVFVRDKANTKVVHVRKVRLGATDQESITGPVTEIAAGLLPGEWVAVTNSGVFRSELLKNNLGAG